jgi:hypothetical protein
MNLPGSPAKLRSRLGRLLDNEELTGPEHQLLIDLMLLFRKLPPPPDSHSCFPKYQQLHERFVHGLVELDDGDEIEERFLQLYEHVHMHEAPYTRQERQRMDESGGYWCHAGGPSPILKAGAFIQPHTVSADFGAGNGLQCLLMQKLFPHKLTVQIEISSKMVAIGRELQLWLEIPEDRIDWKVGDVLDQSATGFDLIYLYRPVRPDGKGKSFYERFAADVESHTEPVVIMSVTDCLRPFLPDRFKVVYSDGHLTCYHSDHTESPV